MASRNRSKPKLIKNLKIFIIIAISFILILEFFPSVYSSPTGGINRTVGDYGVLKSLDLVLQDKDFKTNSAQIENETKNRLDQMILIEHPTPVDSPDFEVKKITVPDPLDHEPIAFKEMEKNTIVNNTSILDFLLEQPLNYWIFARTEGKDTWTKAILRRTFALPDFNPSKWYYVDLDHNNSTGVDDENTILVNDPHHEIRVRFDLTIEDWSFDRPILPRNVLLKGGFSITIERLVNKTFPLELFILKSISYEGENFIWTTGAKFSVMPENYKLSLLAETIKISGFRERILNTSKSISPWDLLNSTLAEINGPYSLRYQFDMDITAFDIIAGLIKYENQSLSDKNWLAFYFTPAPEYDHIPRSAEIWVDSTDVQAPIDQLRYRSGISDQLSKYKIPQNIRLRYGELRKQLIYADVEWVNVPEWLTLNIDYTKVVDGQNVTVLDYTAQDVLSKMDYNSYLFPYYYLGSNHVNCTHLLIEDLPTHFTIEMTSDIGRDVLTPPSRDPQSGIVANILDNLLMRFANRFYRIGKYLKLASEGVLDLPGKAGGALINVYDGQFTSLEFYQTSNEYLDMHGNFVAFYNSTQPLPDSMNSNSSALQNASIPSNNSDITLAVSLRLNALQWANLSFGTQSEFELRMLDGQGFNGLFVDGEDFAVGSISNLPEYIKIITTDNVASYSTIDPDSNDPHDEIIEHFEFRSKVNKQLMQLQLIEIPGKMAFGKSADKIGFSTTGDEDGYIKEINFMITSDHSQPSYKLASGNFMVIIQNDEHTMGSGRLSGIKNMTLVQSENGYFEVNLNEEIPFQVMLVNNKGNFTKAKVILDPLPSRLRFQLPGVVKQTNIGLPDFRNITGGIDFSQFVFTLGRIGNDLIDLMSNMSQTLIESIGNIGFNFSISYELESYGSSLDIIAEIERGGIPVSDSDDIYATATNNVLGNSIGWTHGIIMHKDVHEQKEILRGHLYLQGMPSKASLSTHIAANRTQVDISFWEYNPRYNWLLLDIHGIQDRDVNVFYQNIPSDIDFHTSVDLVANLEIGGEMWGNVLISITDSGSDVCTRELGSLYINMHTYEPIQSIREFLISDMPSKLELDFSISRDMVLNYQASEEVEFIYSKLSKRLTDSWHHVNMILHDLPKNFAISLVSNNAFDMDEPLPLQGLPTINVHTNNTNTLDFKLFIDGAAVGQRGNNNLFLENVQDLHGRFKGDSYRIESKGLDYIRLKITDLPILDNYKINSILLEAESLRSLEFKVNLLFGVFPYFDLGKDSEGKIEITLEHTIKLFGQSMRAKVVFIDMVYENAGGLRVPVATSEFVNTINSDLKRSQNHIVMPAILVSLIITWLNNI